MNTQERILHDQLLAMALHDLRKSVQPVRSVLAVVLGNRVGELSPMQHEFLTIAEQASKRVSRLIDDVEAVLESGYERALVIDVLDLVNLMKRCVDEFRLLAQSREVEIAFDSGTPAVAVEADAQAMEQILLNLIDNAVNYCASGATVSVRLRTSRSRVAISVENPIETSRPDDGSAWIQAGTRGSGHAQVGGRGLGLAVVKRLSELLGGALVTRVTADAVTMCVVLQRTGRLAASTS
jgi:signal transduction histidine kinase